MRELTCRMRKGPRVGRLTVEFMSAAGGSSAAKSTAKRPKLSLSRKRPLGTNTQTPVQPPQPPPPPNPPQEVPQIQIAPSTHRRQLQMVRRKPRRSGRGIESGAPRKLRGIGRAHRC